MKQLIINADDFGMSREVNEGTKRGIKAGTVTSVSLMVNMPYFEDAIKFLRKYPHISVGLHFNLTEGRSVLHPNKVSNLLREDDYFYYWPQLIFKVITNKKVLLEIVHELQAQYDALKKTGLTITHIDSHHHIHLYPAILKYVIKFAQKNNLKYIRGNRFNIWNITLGIARKPTLTQTVVNSLLLLNSFLFFDGFSSNEINHFFDINWAYTIRAIDFARVLEHLPDGKTELICHLAILSSTGNKKFLLPRKKTLELLTQHRIKKILLKNGIKLIQRRE